MEGKLDWTDYSVWILLDNGILVLICAVLSFMGYPMQVLMVLLSLVGNLTLMAICYRFREMFLTKIVQGNKIVNWTGDLLLCYIYLLGADTLVRLPYIWMVADMDIQTEYFSVINILNRIIGIIGLLACSIGAKIGWNLYKYLNKSNKRMPMLGIIFMVLSILGVIGSLSIIFGKNNPSQVLFIQPLSESLPEDLIEIIKIGIVAVVIFAIALLWIFLWPIRIVVKIFQECSAESKSNELKDDRDRKVKSILITSGVVIILAFFVFLFSDKSFGKHTSRHQYDTSEQEMEFFSIENRDDLDTKYQDDNEQSLIAVINSTPYKKEGKLKVHYYKGNFIHREKRSPIMLAFCFREDPDNWNNNLCGVAYKNMTGGLILDMNVLYTDSEIQLTGYDKMETLEIILQDVIDEEGGIGGLATYGKLRTNVEICPTEQTFKLPDNMKLLMEQHLPDWVSISVINIFGKPDLAIYPYKWMRGLFRSLSEGLEKTGHFEGYINESPITMEMKIDMDGTVSGRYAYDITLKKYGNKPDSWFPLRGNVLLDNSYRAYVLLESKNPDTKQVFEYILLEYSPYDSWKGHMFNQKYLEDPEKHHLYEFNISAKENE